MYEQNNQIKRNNEKKVLYVTEKEGCWNYIKYKIILWMWLGKTIH